jgi:hypothetical protein
MGKSRKLMGTAHDYARSYTSRIVDLPLSPEPARQLMPDVGNQDSVLTLLKFRTSSLRIWAMLIPGCLDFFYRLDRVRPFIFFRFS